MTSHSGTARAVHTSDGGRGIVKFENLDHTHIRKAVEIHRDLAWPPGSEGSPRANLAPILAATNRDEALTNFERGDAGDTAVSRRFALRIGNHRYPFMKLVLQEHLVAGELYFEVDTHDRLDMPTDGPDYEQWLALKRFNRELKGRIERAWSAAGLPTGADLAARCGELARDEIPHVGRGRLVLVDDDDDVRGGLALLLRARGFDVEEFHDGSAALVRLERRPHPDLVLLDYEMPQVSGPEVLARMRTQPELAHVPVLMATAAKIRLEEVPQVAGLLHKPYPRQVLFEMIDHLIARSTKA